MFPNIYDEHNYNNNRFEDIDEQQNGNQDRKKPKCKKTTNPEVITKKKEFLNGVTDFNHAE